METTFGHFIFLAKEKKPEVTYALNDVKKKIAQALLVEENKKTYGDKKREAWDKLLAEGKSIEPQLKADKVDIKKTGPFSLSQGNVPGIGASDAIIDTIFSLSQAKPLAPKLVQVGDSYYFLKLRSVETPKATDKVKSLEDAQRAQESAFQTELISQWVSGLQKTGKIKQEIKFGKAEPETATN